MTIFDILAEQRVAEALRRGELDNLPGAGRPLVLSEDPFVPGEQRMANRILANAGLVPAELGLRREIAALRAELAALAPGERRTLLRRRLVLLLMQWGELHRC